MNKHTAAVDAAIKSTFKTCNTCFHSDNAHDDGSGHLDVCFVCAAENENPKTVCLKFNDSGCAPCPFCGSGAVIIEAPSPAGGDRVVYDAFCIDEECGARIEGCATKGAARRLWNNRSSLKPDSGEEKNDE